MSTPAKTRRKQTSSTDDLKALGTGMAINFGSKEAANFITSRLGPAPSENSPDYGKYANAAMALYNAYQRFQNGDKTGAALSTADAANSVYEGYTGNSGYGGYIAAAKGANDLNNIRKSDMSGRQKGLATRDSIRTNVGTYFGGYWVPIAKKFANERWGGTMNRIDALDERTNPGTWAMKQMFTGKSKAQAARDYARKSSRKLGGQFSKNDKGSDIITFADGTVFDAGKDGHFRLKNAAGVERANFEVDASDPRAAKQASYNDMLMSLRTGGATQSAQAFADNKQGAGITGFREYGGILTNAELASKDPKAAAREIAKTYGYDYKTAMAKIKQIQEGGGFDSIDKSKNDELAGNATRTASELWDQAGVDMGANGSPGRRKHLTPQEQWRANQKAGGGSAPSNLVNPVGKLDPNDPNVRALMDGLHGGAQAPNDSLDLGAVAAGTANGQIPAWWSGNRGNIEPAGNAGVGNPTYNTTDWGAMERQATMRPYKNPVGNLSPEEASLAQAAMAAGSGQQPDQDPYWRARSKTRRKSA